MSVYLKGVDLDCENVDEIEQPLPEPKKQPKKQKAAAAAAATSTADKKAPKIRIKPVKGADGKLILTHAADIAKVQQLIDRMMQNSNVKKLIHGNNTTRLERFQSERLKFLSKRLEYWSSWKWKCALTHLIHNLGYEKTLQRIISKLQELKNERWLLGWEGGEYLTPMLDMFAKKDENNKRDAARHSTADFNQRKLKNERAAAKRRQIGTARAKSEHHEYSSGRTLQLE